MKFPEANCLQKHIYHNFCLPACAGIFPFVFPKERQVYCVELDTKAHQKMSPLFMCWFHLTNVFHSFSAMISTSMMKQDKTMHPRKVGFSQISFCRGRTTCYAARLANEDMTHENAAMMMTFLELCERRHRLLQIFWQIFWLHIPQLLGLNPSTGNKIQLVTWGVGQALLPK